MAAPRRGYGPIQLPNYLGLQPWQFAHALARGLIPDPDLPGGRWSAALVDTLDPDRIRAQVPRCPNIGAARATEVLAASTGLEVGYADVEALAEQGFLRVCGRYKGWPLYDGDQLHALHHDQAAVDSLRVIIAERQAWLAASMTGWEAADRLGWRIEELTEAATRRAITPGRFGRYLRADIERLAGDPALCAAIDAARLLGPDQAAARLGIRRTDFDYCVAAGWIRPAAWVESQVSRRRWVSVPLYRTHTVDALLDIDRVDWAAVRACRPGEPSPLRSVAPRPPSRAQVVHRFIAGLRDRYGAPVWASFDGRTDRWRIGWDPVAEDAERIEAIVRAALAEDPSIARFLTRIDLAGPETTPVRRLAGPVNTRWIDDLVQDVGPEPGPDAHVVHWSEVDDEP
jgi:hypothetical protein